MVTDPRAAIVMIRRDETGRIVLVDSAGKERTATEDRDLRLAIDAILDDPDIPQVEQVAHLEHAAEQVIVQATAHLLPEVARPLAGPLVRDMAAAIRKAGSDLSQRRAQTAAREPIDQRKARARANRIRRSRHRLGGSVKRKGDAA